MTGRVATERPGKMALPPSAGPLLYVFAIVFFAGDGSSGRADALLSCGKIMTSTPSLRTFPPAARPSAFRSSESLVQAAGTPSQSGKVQYGGKSWSPSTRLCSKMTMESSSSPQPRVEGDDPHAAGDRSGVTGRDGSRVPAAIGENDVNDGAKRSSLLARMACCALLPSVAAGFAGVGGFRGGASSFGGISPLLANQWYVWATLLASSSAGLWSERTRWGAAVSSPLVTMLLTITLCNVGILPASSPAYNTVNQVFVPLAVPLLLFDADLRKVLRFAGTLLACFVIGAAGTVVGTAAAAAVVPLGLGADGWKIASALAARHIGGAVNYVAVCETLGVSADAVVAGLAADNMVVSLYFVFLFWITKPESKQKPAELGSTPEGTPLQESKSGTDGLGAGELGEGSKSVNKEGNKGLQKADAALPMTKETISYALTAACALVLAGELVSKVAFGGRISAIPLVTLATVAGATAAPSMVGRLGSVGAELGVLFMQLFFAVTGAQGSLAVVMGTAPSLLVFSLVQIAVHFGFLVGVGRLVRLPFRELALASNANVGGPTTAAAMAAAKGWKTLVLPALLTGVLGYATATFIGVGIGHAVLKSIIGIS